MLQRLLSPFVLAFSAIVVALYAYLALRLTGALWPRLALAVPFLLIWVVPAIYWAGDKEGHSRFDEWVHAGSYVSMGWLSFAVLLSLVRDALLAGAAALPRLAPLASFLASDGGAIVLAGSMAALVLGMAFALLGPAIVRVEIPVTGLDHRLDGLTVVQITDLHVGPTIRAGYVRRVVARAKALAPDFFALTGDFVDGPVSRLGPHLAPLAELAAAAPAFFVTGNHEYYAGARRWVAQFRALGLRVLENDYALFEKNGARVLVGGVNDPAAGRVDRRLGPQPEAAAGAREAVDLRLLLAHNPRLAPLTARAGFQVQLSGHTHAGQFFPWTLAVKLVHAPHVVGLSREGGLWVYVSPGTGSWGPPVRFGTRPEISLITLRAA